MACLNLDFDVNASLLVLETGQLGSARQSGLVLALGVQVGVHHEDCGTGASAGPTTSMMEFGRVYELTIRKEGSDDDSETLFGKILEDGQTIRFRLTSITKMVTTCDDGEIRESVEYTTTPSWLTKSLFSRFTLLDGDTMKLDCGFVYCKDQHLIKIEIVDLGAVVPDVVAEDDDDDADTAELAEEMAQVAM